MLDRKYTIYSTYVSNIKVIHASAILLKFLSSITVLSWVFQNKKCKSFGYKIPALRRRNLLGHDTQGFHGAHVTPYVLFFIGSRLRWCDWNIKAFNNTLGVSFVFFRVRWHGTGCTYEYAVGHKYSHTVLVEHSLMKSSAVFTFGCSEVKKGLFNHWPNFKE